MPARNALDEQAGHVVSQMPSAIRNFHGVGENRRHASSIEPHERSCLVEYGRIEGIAPVPNEKRRRLALSAIGIIQWEFPEID
jgi:hypothetical protein